MDTFLFVKHEHIFNVEHRDIFDVEYENIFIYNMEKDVLFIDFYTIFEKLIRPPYKNT